MTISRLQYDNQTYTFCWKFSTPLLQPCWYQTAPLKIAAYIKLSKMHVSNNYNVRFANIRQLSTNCQPKRTARNVQPLAERSKVRSTWPFRPVRHDIINQFLYTSGFSFFYFPLWWPTRQQKPQTAECFSQHIMWWKTIVKM